MEQKTFPWDNGVKPVFVNKEGFEWYVDESLTQRANRDHPLGHPPLNTACFMVSKDEKFLSRVLIERGTNDILADEPDVEEMVSKIDKFRAAKHLKPY